MLKALKKALAPPSGKSKSDSGPGDPPPAHLHSPTLPGASDSAGPGPYTQHSPATSQSPPSSMLHPDGLPSPSSDQDVETGTHALQHLGLDGSERLDYSPFRGDEDKDSSRREDEVSTCEVCGDGAAHPAAEEGEGAAAEEDGAAAGREHGDGAATNGGDGHHTLEDFPGLVYLCAGDDPERDETMSVVSDAMTEEELAEELTELARALEALEVEGSERTPSKALSATLESETEHGANLVGLYNTMAVKLMDAKNYENALSLLRKAEGMAEEDRWWDADDAAARSRLRCITFNNLGCLFRRRNSPAEALQYLGQALALGRKGGNAQSMASTHLNVCAAYSSLRRPREALGHAERAAILLQHELFVPSTPNFNEGLTGLAARLTADRKRTARTSCSVLAMAYHNAALAHEGLGSMTEARVAFARACAVADRCLGPKTHTASSLHKAEKSFLARHQRTPIARPVKKTSSVTNVVGMSRQRPPSVTGRSSTQATNSKSALLKPPPATQSKNRLL